MKKSTYFCLSIAVLVLLAFGFTSALPAYAAEAKQENKAAAFFKNLFKWPFGVAKKEAETAGKTTEKAVTTVKETGVSAVETITGKPEEIKDVVVEPVKGSAETAYTAVEGTIKAPVEAAQEITEAEKK